MAGILITGWQWLCQDDGWWTMPMVGGSSKRFNQCAHTLTHDLYRKWWLAQTKGVVGAGMWICFERHSYVVNFATSSQFVYDCTMATFVRCLEHPFRTCAWIVEISSYIPCLYGQTNVRVKRSGGKFLIWMTCREFGGLCHTWQIHYILLKRAFVYKNEYVRM